MFAGRVARKLTGHIDPTDDGRQAAVARGWQAVAALTDIEPPHSAVPYLIAIVAAIVVNYALAWLFAALRVAHALTGLKIALACWFGFLFVQYASISVFSAFETNPWPLILINMGPPFLAFAISGIVLGAWRRREP